MINSVIGAFYYCFMTFQGYEASLRTDDSSEEIAKLSDVLSALRSYCDGLELRESVNYLDWMARQMVGDTFKLDFRHYVKAATTIIENEATTRYVYHLKKDKADLYYRVAGKMGTYYITVSFNTD